MCVILGRFCWCLFVTINRILLTLLLACWVAGAAASSTSIKLLVFPNLSSFWSIFEFKLIYVQKSISDHVGLAAGLFVHWELQPGPTNGATARIGSGGAAGKGI